MTRPPSDYSVDLLLSHGAFVRRLAYSLCRDNADADDVAQEAMVAALRNPPDVSRPLEPWFAAVVRNCARKLRRGESRREAREEAVAGQFDATGEDPSAAAARLEEQRILVEEVSRLEEPFRTTIHFRYFDGLSSVEIARRMGVPDSTVRTRLMRGLARLREAMDRRHGGDRRAWVLLLLPQSGTTAPRPGLVPWVVGGAAAAVVAAILFLTYSDFPRPQGPTVPTGSVRIPRMDSPTGSHEVTPETNRVPAMDESPRARLSTAPLPEAPVRTLRGLVVDPHGDPVVGAAVEATLVGRVTASPGQAEFVVSGGDGCFVLPGVPQGAVRIRAYLTGIGSAAVDLDDPDGDVEGLRLELRTGTRLYGKVSTPEGASPAGATVVVERATSGKARFATTGGKGPALGNLVWEPAATVHPDEDGEWEAVVPWDQGEFRVGAREEGRLDAGPVAITLARDTKEVHVDLAFEVTGALEGIVIASETGLPQGGVSVTAVALRPLSQGGSQATRAHPPVRGVTDAEGRFLLPLLPSGTVLVSAETNRGADVSIRAKVPGSVRLVLPAPGDTSISGRVTTSTGAPAGRIEVAAVGEGETHSYRYRTVTRDDGAFELSGLEPGEWMLRAWRGRRDGAANVLGASAGPFPPGTHDVLIRVDVGLVLEGCVVDTEGRPVAGAPVSALPEEPTTRALGGSGFQASDAEGRFRIEGLRDGPYELVVHPPLGRDGVLSISRARGRRPGGPPVEIVLQAGLSIEGTVQGPDGRALEGGSVRAEPLDPGADPEPVTWRSGRIGPEGRFSIRGLGPGTYLLRLFGWDADFKPALGVLGGPTRPPSLVLIGGERVEAGDPAVRLRAGPGLQIRGRVVDAGGAPVAKAQVWVRPPVGKDIILVYSGVDGSFSVCGLEEDTGYFVEAFKAGYRPAKLAGLRAGDSIARLVMDRGLESSGRVLDADGTAVARARMELVPVEAPDIKRVRGAETDDEGAFVAGNLEAVEYRVRVAFSVPGTSEVLWVDAGRIRGGARDAVQRMTR